MDRTDVPQDIRLSVSLLLDKVCEEDKRKFKKCNEFLNVKSMHRRTRSDTPNVHTSFDGITMEPAKKEGLLRKGTNIESKLRAQHLDMEDAREQHIKWMKQTLHETKINLAKMQEKEITMEMEKENEHFYVCEMVLSTIEQMKWHQSLANMQAPAFSRVPSRTESENPQLNHLSSSSGIKSYDTLSDEYPSSELSLDGLGGSASFSEPSSSFGSPFSTSQIDYSQQPSTSSAIQTTPPIDLTNVKEHSPEWIALNLLSHFAQDQALEIEDADWLVSFSDAPQSLIPLPSATPVPPDQVYATQPGDDTSHRVRLRGTFDWAPPRPALIFKLHHPTPKLKEGLAAQNWKCAGCRLSVENNVLLKRVRYCEYSGRYFCQCCHRGARTIIPARVLYKWDFRAYPVSDYAARFLEENHRTPAISLHAHNRQLYDKVKSIRNMVGLRRQLLHMWQYIRTCRIAAQVITDIGKLREKFESLPLHYLQEADLYCMRDFVETYEGTGHKKLEPILYYAKYHILNCTFCKAQAFFCEICEDSADLLFPFLESTVYSCKLCGACSHWKCVKKLKRNFSCPRCDRIRSRHEIMDLPTTSQTTGTQ